MFPINSESNVLESQDIRDYYISLKKDNEYLIEQIDAYNDLEDLELLSDDGFVKRTKYLSKLVGAKEQKVWGEYYYVNHNVKKPVLFSKATAIPLTKNEVIKLIDDLTVRYLDLLMKVGGSNRIVNQKNKVPLRFSKEKGAHFNPNYTEIKFYEYGDWRFGYNGVFCAETVFHEFAHLLDAKRNHRTNIDAHDEIFVRKLEGVLSDYEIWIEERYNRNNLINQILLNSELLNLWNRDKSFIISKNENIKEKIDSDVKDLIREDLESSGVKDDKIPLSFIFNENDNDILNLVIENLNEYKKTYRDIPYLNRTKKQIKDNGFETILTHKQTSLLMDSLMNLDSSIYTKLGYSIFEEDRVRSSIENGIKNIKKALEIDVFNNSDKRILNF